MKRETAAVRVAASPVDDGHRTREAGSASSTAARVLISLSFWTVGAGRMLMPARCRWPA